MIRSIGNILDGRLCFGNGHFLAAFVGALEAPETPAYAVHDKISRLWLGYPSSPSTQVGLAPVVTEVETGRQWRVGACDSYRYEDGAVIMETDIPPGRIRTETYGLWDKPVLVRRIIFTPNAGATGPYLLSTAMSLYRWLDASKPEGDPQALAGYNVIHQCDRREWPASHTFPRAETIRRVDGRTLDWRYDDERYRSVMVMVAEEGGEIGVTNHGVIGDSGVIFTGEQAGGVWFRSAAKAGSQTLTVVAAFGRDPAGLPAMLSESTPEALKLETTQRRWSEWFENGAVVKTGDPLIDGAYRNQLMLAKAAIDSGSGGQVVGARYQIPTIWPRDMNISISVFLDTGHPEEAKQMLTFLARHAAWNERNNCFHANMHASSRVLHRMCAPGQRPVEELVQPGEWTNQMAGPQLDALPYFLYNVAKYHRVTGDTAFIREHWEFILKVGNSLACDDDRFAEWGGESGFYGKDRRYKKYNEETGLIIDDCWESGNLAEYSLTNAIAIVALRDGWALSVKMGDAQASWKARVDQLEPAFHKHLVRDVPGVGPKLLRHVPRPWMRTGKGEPAVYGREDFLHKHGYAWSLSTTVPYFNHRSELYRRVVENSIPPDGEVEGWGMWWATTAHAAFEGDRADIGWNYLSKYLAQLPPSLQAYEHHIQVPDDNGLARRATLDLWSFAYLPHCLVRVFLGLGYDGTRQEWFFRPQIPREIGQASGRVVIGKTVFEVTARGSGTRLLTYTINGTAQPEDGTLAPEFLDGGLHRVVLQMSDPREENR